MMKNSGEDTENGGGANGEPTEKQSKVEADWDFLGHNLVHCLGHNVVHRGVKCDQHMALLFCGLNGCVWSAPLISWRKSYMVNIICER